MRADQTTTNCHSERSEESGGENSSLHLVRPSCSACHDPSWEPVRGHFEWEVAVQSLRAWLGYFNVVAFHLYLERLKWIGGGTHLNATCL